MYYYYTISIMWVRILFTWPSYQIKHLKHRARQYYVVFLLNFYKMLMTLILLRNKIKTYEFRENWSLLIY